MSFVRALIPLIALLPNLAQAEPDATEERPGLAALDIKASHGVPPELAQLMGEILLSELKASGQFGSVLGSSDMQAMLDMEQQKTALGCEEDSCLAQLGGALGVPYLLTASLGKLGESFVITVKIIEVDAAEVKVRAVENAAHEQHLRPVLAYLVGVATSELFGGKKPERPTLEAVAPKVATKSKPLNKRMLARMGGIVATVGGLGLYAYSAQQVSRGEQMIGQAEGANCPAGQIPTQGSNCAKRFDGQAVVRSWAPRQTGGLVVSAVGLLATAAAFIF